MHIMSTFTSKTPDQVAQETQAYIAAWDILNNFKNNETTLVEIIKNLILAGTPNQQL
jgi:hypothetical protein